MVINCWKTWSENKQSSIQIFHSCYFHNFNTRNQSNFFTRILNSRKLRVSILQGNIKSPILLQSASFCWKGYIFSTNKSKHPRLKLLIIPFIIGIIQRRTTFLMFWNFAYVHLSHVVQDHLVNVKVLYYYFAPSRIVWHSQLSIEFRKDNDIFERGCSIKTFWNTNGILHRHCGTVKTISQHHFERGGPWPSIGWPALGPLIQYFPRKSKLRFSHTYILIFILSDLVRSFCFSMETESEWHK